MNSSDGSHSPWQQFGTSLRGLLSHLARPGRRTARPATPAQESPAAGGGSGGGGETAYCRMLSNILDQLPQHIFAKDREGRFLVVNRAKAAHHGLEPGQMIGLTNADLPPESLPEGTQALETDHEVLHTGEQALMERYLVRDRAGQPRYRTLQKAPLRGPDGATVGVIAISSDVTEEVQAAQARRSSEERFRLLAEATPYALFIARRADGQLLFANSAAREVFRLEGEATQYHSLEFFADLGDRAELLTRLREQESLRNYEGRCRRVDGTEFWAMASTSRAELDGEAVLITSLVDITERRAAQERASRSERLLRAVFDHLPANLFVKDTEGRYLMANREFADMVGCSENDLIGSTWEEVARRFGVSTSNMVMRDEAVLQGETLTFEENEVRRGDAEPRYQHLVKAPLRSGDGTVIGLIGVSTNVTRRVRAERELRRSQRLLASILDALPVSVFVRDLAGRYQIVNRDFCEGLGLPPERVVGRHYQECLAEAGLALESDRIEPGDSQVVEGHSRVEIPNLVARFADGRVQSWSYVRVPLQDEQGTVTGVIGALTDVTDRMQAEQAIRERDRELEFAQEIGGVGTWRRDLATDALSWSGGTHRVWGFAADAPLPAYADLLERVHPEDRARFEATRREAVRTGEAFSDHSRILWPDGSLHYTRTVGEVLKDPEGQPVALIGLTQDVTEQVATERALREGQQRFRVIAEYLPFSLTIIDREDGRVLFANDGFRRDFGIEEELEHYRVEDFYANPGDRAAVLEEYRRQGHYGPRETLFRRKDGSTFWAYVSGAEIQFGDRPAYLSSWVDVTARKRAEEELRASRRLLEIVIDAIPMWVFVKDAHSNYVMVNRTMAEFFGISKEQFLTLHTSQLPSAESTQALALENDRWVYEHRATLDQPRVVLERPDGTPVPFHSVKTPLFDESGALIGLLGVNRDISAAERAQAELQASRDVLQAIFDTIPHGIFLKDARGRFRMVNRAHAAKWHLEPEAMIGMRMGFEDRAPAAELRAVVESDRQVLERRETARIEGERMLADGRPHLLSTIKAPLLDASGAPVGIVGITEDITERHLAEAERKRFQTLIETILNNVPIILWSADLQGTVTFSAGKGLYGQGLAPDTVVGQSVFTLYADYPRFLAKVRQALAGEAVIDVSETRGAIYERWMKPLQDAAGNCSGLIGVSLDVTERERSQRELKATRELLEYIVRNSPMIVYALDPSGRFTFAEGQGLGRVHADPGTMMGRSLGELLPGRADVVEPHLASLRSGEPLNLTARLGGRTWDIYFAPRVNEAGETIGSFGIGTDVTERVEALRNVEESELKFRSLAEGSLQGILVFKDTRVMFANPGALRIFGYDSLEAVQRLQRPAELFAPHERRRLVDYYRHRVTGEPAPTRYEAVGLRPDSTTFAVECLASVVNWEGTNAVQLAVLDISDRKRAEDELRNSQALLRTVVDALPQGVYVKDLEGRFELVNRSLARFHGIPAADLIGRTSAEMASLSEADAREMERQDRQVIVSRRPVIGEARTATRTDGRLRWIHTHKAPLVDSSGRVIRIVGTVEDITERRLFQARLEASERHYRDLFEGSLQAILIHAGGRPVLVNQALCDLVGIASPQEFYQVEDIFRFIPAEDRDELRARMQQRLAGDHVPESYEVRILHTDGSIRHVVHYSSIVELEGREVVQMTLLDITELKRATAEREAHRRLLQAVLETVPAPIFLKNAEGRYEMVNSALAEFYRTTPEALLGLHVSELPMIGAEEKARLLAEDESVLASGRSILRREVTRTAGDGSQRIFQITKSPLFDAQGRVTHIVGHSSDITDIKQAERALRESGHILEQINDAVIVVDLNDRITRWSKGAERMYGYTADDVRGRNVAMLWPSDVDGQARQQALYQEVLFTQGHAAIVERQNKSGERFFISVSLSALKDERGNVYGVVGTSQDVTDLVRAERALREHRALLRSVIDAIPSRLVVRGLDGSKLLANKAMAALVGATPDEFIANSKRYPALSPEEAEVAASQDRIVMAEERSVEYESERPGADGTTEWANVRKVPLLDEDGRLAGVVTVDEVITERKLAQLALSRSERLYRDLVEGSIQGVLIYRDFEIQFVSQPLAEMLGYQSAAELAQLKDAWRLLAPGSLAAMRETVARRERGEPVPQTMEVQMLRKDGSPIWVERRYAPIVWEGSPAAQVVIHDINDRKLAEMQLQESESRARRAFENLQLAVESTPTGIALYDSDDRLIICNRLFRSYFPSGGANIEPGMTFREVVQRFVTERGLKSPQREEPGWLDQRVSSHRDPAEPIQLHLWDGRRLRVIEHRSDTAGVSSVYVDVTELLEAQSALQALNAELEQRVEERTQELRAAQAELVTKERLATLGLLTGVVSHELRNPLGTIRTSFFIVGDVVRGAGLGLEADLARIDRNIDRCDRIIEELLAYTRPGESHPEPVDLDALVREVLEEARVQEGVRLVPELGGLTAARLDRERMRRALINIVQNAAQAITQQAGRASGTVRVQTRHRGERIEIRVVDDGPGIAEESRDRIFEPLYSTKGFGVGLGLPIVRQIMESHGGGIEVHSDGSSGTTVVLWLPTLGA